MFVCVCVCVYTCVGLRAYAVHLCAEYVCVCVCVCVRACVCERVCQCEVECYSPGEIGASNGSSVNAGV